MHPVRISNRISPRITIPKNNLFFITSFQPLYIRDAFYYADVHHAQKWTDRCKIAANI